MTNRFFCCLFIGSATFFLFALQSTRSRSNVAQHSVPVDTCHIHPCTIRVKSVHRTIPATGCEIGGGVMRVRASVHMMIMRIIGASERRRRIKDARNIPHMLAGSRRSDKRARKNLRNFCSYFVCARVECKSRGTHSPPIEHVCYSGEFSRFVGDCGSQPAKN